MSNKPISSIANINPSLTKSIKNTDLVTFLGMADVSNNGGIIAYTTKQYKEVKDGFTKFQENDILFAKITPCMENGKGAIAKNLNNGIGFGSTEFHVLRANEFGDPEFIYHVLQSNAYRLKAEAMMTGSAGQKRVPTDFFYKHKIYIPPLPTQRKIAEILNTSDEVIEQTRALIEKYQNIKKGMLHDLFTRGIDPTTKKLRQTREQAPHLYHETELGWLPRVWNVKKLIKSASNKPNSFTGGPFGSDLKSEHYTIEGIRIIQLQNIGDGSFLNDYKIFTSEKKANQLISCNIYPGDIIIAKMADPVARACIIPEFHSRYLMASDGIRLNVDNSHYNTRFILEVINSSKFRKKAIAVSTGTTRERIGLNELRNLPIYSPKKNEQDIIAERLEAIDNKIETEQTYLNKMINIKQGLMQDLLTGKVLV